MSSKQKKTLKQRDVFDMARQARLRVDIAGFPLIPPYELIESGHDELVPCTAGDVLLVRSPIQTTAVMCWRKIYQVTGGRVVKLDPEVWTSCDVVIMRFVDRTPEELSAACSFAKWAWTNYKIHKWWKRFPMTNAGFTTRFIERAGFVPVGDPSRIKVETLVNWFLKEE